MTTHKINNPEVSGLILAGGKATRMGGDDKGLIKLAGKPIVQHLADQLATQCHKVQINANRNLDAYAQLGYKVISDQLENFQGPLAGMLSGMRHCQSQWMITAPGDAPFLDKQYVSNMQFTREQKYADAAVAYAENRMQPVYLLLNVNLIESLNKFLDGGDRKIDRWLATINTAVVDFSHCPQMFININTPEQLREVEGLMCENTPGYKTGKKHC